MKYDRNSVLSFSLIVVSALTSQPTIAAAASASRDGGVLNGEVYDSSADDRNAAINHDDAELDNFDLFLGFGEEEGPQSARFDSRPSAFTTVVSPRASSAQALPAMSGRAAASSNTRTDGTSSPLIMWYTGSVAAGAQQHWYWNNAGSAAYKVGLAPAGATPMGSCSFQVVRSWDVQKPGGEREFHFMVQNTSSFACGTNIHIQSQAASNTWTTGTINPGSTKSWTWNNANPLTAAHFVNLSPSGASSSTSCELEVTRAWYTQQPSKEREFSFYVKNVGSIACSGTVLLAVNANANSSWSTGTISPGATASWYWNNANPINRVYFAGVSPLGTSTTTPCQLELIPTSYVQMMNADRTLQRRFLFGVKNVGSISCSGTLLLNYQDPSYTNPLPVNMFPQQVNNWCWAASGQMIMSYLGGYMSQCEQANERFNRNDCCNTPTPGACDVGGWPEFDKYGFSFDTGGALSWTDLKAQIDTRLTPFAFSWHWDGGGGHMMVVTGYKVINGQNWVTINDPWAPNEGDQRTILYSDYVDGSGYYHWTDYYNVAWE